jgi:phage portal protein BeeE
MSRLFGPDGEPLFSASNGNGHGLIAEDEEDHSRISKFTRTLGKESVHTKWFLNQINTYLDSLAKVKLPADMRAQDPFSNHSWVFGAAMATAVAAAEAPFTVFHETPDMVQFRNKKRVQDGLAPTQPRTGSRRRAAARYMRKSSMQRMFARISNKGIVPDDSHPITDVLEHPNPFQTQRQLFQLTHVWMQVRGECFWIMTDADGLDPVPGQLPTYIWPISPDLVQPCYEYVDHGDLIGWWYFVPRWMPNATSGSTFYGTKQVLLPLTSVVQFKFPNPLDPVRGMSKITASALNIEADLRIKGHNLGILRNQAVPRGIITYLGTLSQAEQDAYMKKWRDKHEGEFNAGKTSILANGFQYQTIGLSHADMEYMAQLKWNRDEILAAMGVPPSVLGLSGEVPYATALVDKKHMWDGNVTPLLTLEEEAIDGSIFFTEDDSTFGMFDMKDVEALRAPLNDKVLTADKMTSQNLHMPPTVAYEIVGLEVEAYDNDDQAFVPSTLIQAKGITDTPPAAAAAAAPGGGAGGLLNPHAGNPLSKPTDEHPSAPPGGLLDPWSSQQQHDLDNAAHNSPVEMLSYRRRLKQYGKTKSRSKAEFLKFHNGIEAEVAQEYRQWVGKMKSQAMERFDRAARQKDLHTKVDLSAVLPSQKDASNALMSETLAMRAKTIESVYNFTQQEMGPAVFEIDDPRIVEFFNQRERFFADHVASSQRGNWANAMAEGVRNGENLDQIRQRLSQSFNNSMSTAKTMTVARTETGGLVNGMRDKMFEAQGFESEQWITAGDEEVRDTHMIYGSSGPHEPDFDYLQLSINAGEGVLTYPQDMECTALDEVINCRCFKIPIRTAKQRAFVEEMHRRILSHEALTRRAKELVVHVTNEAPKQPIRTEQVFERKEGSIVKITNIPVYE